MIPKVSIVIPIYKVPEEYLRTCIESCINQTLKDIEIILVDDGSPDFCGNICDQYAQIDSRVRVIHKTNGGLSSARNVGQDKAVGLTLMFLDGDDFIDLNCCEILYNALISNNVDIVIFGETLEYGHSNKELLSLGESDYLLSPDEVKSLQARVLDYNGGVATAYMKLIKRDLLINNCIRHIDELKQGAEGYVFCIQLFKFVSSAYYVAKPYYHYIYNNLSICHVSTDVNNYLILRCFDFIFNFIKGQSNERELRNRCLSRFLYIIITVAISGCFNPAITRSYNERVKAFKKFMKEELPQTALKIADRSKLDKQRRIVLKLIDLKFYWAIYIIGKVRRRQLVKK